jgi:hypothetical protein
MNLMPTDTPMLRALLVATLCVIPTVEWTGGTALAAGTESNEAVADLGGPPAFVLNEIRRLTTPISADAEFVEVAGTGSLDGLTILVVMEQTYANPGFIYGVVDLTGHSTTGGYFTAGTFDAAFGVTPDLAVPIGTLNANGSATWMLVEGFTGVWHGDLDSNNDGVFDSTPWTSILDSVTLGAGGGHYSSNVINARFKIQRCASANDDWVIGPTNFTHGYDTMGSANDCAWPMHGCNSPIPVGLGVTPYDLRGTISAEPMSCFSVDDDECELYFEFTAPMSGTYAIHNCGSESRAFLGVIAGTDCSNPTCLETASNDCGPNGHLEIENVLAGDAFLIQLTEWSSIAGTGELTISLEGAPVPGDDCAAPIPIAGLGVFDYDRTHAQTLAFTGGDPVLCGIANGGAALYRDVFLSWTAPHDGTFEISTCPGIDRSRINVYAGVGCSATCLGLEKLDLLCVNHGESRILPMVQGGGEFLIQIGDYNATLLSGGPSILVIDDYVLPNDDCSAPTVIEMYDSSFLNGSMTFLNEPLTSSGFDGGGGPCSPVIQSDLFYLFTAPVDANYVIETCGSSIDTVLSVHEGSDCSATCLDGNNDACGSGSRVILPNLVGGTDYLVQVGGLDPSDEGLVEIRIGIADPPPVNNTCATPTLLDAAGVYPFSTLAATGSGFEGLVPDGECGAVPDFRYRDVFWAFTVPSCGSWEFTSQGSPPGWQGTPVSWSYLTLFDGSDCNATCIDSAPHSSCDLPCRRLVVDDLEMGDQILIRVSSRNFLGEAPHTGYLVIEPLAGPCPPGAIEVLCDPAQEHYAGGPVRLNTSTQGHAFGAGVHLEAVDGPPGEFGFFLIGASATGSTNVFNGTLCLDAPLGRYGANVAMNQGVPELDSVGQFDANGVLQNLVGTSAVGSGFDMPLQLPYSPAGQFVMPGDQWAIQLWYRDQLAPLPNPGSTSNFSNALLLTIP